MSHRRLEPDPFSIPRKGYSAKDFSSDLAVGVLVGIEDLEEALARAAALIIPPSQLPTP